MTTEQAIPKFAVIADALRRRIREGVYAPGSKLPSTNELPAEFGVGKQTIVRVLEDLARDGWIVRRQGVGTFVATETPGRSAKSRAAKSLKLAIVLRRSLKPAVWQLQDWHGQIVAGVLNGLGLDRDALRVSVPEAGAGECGRARMEQPGCAAQVEILGEPATLDSGVPLADLFAGKPDAILPISIFDDAYLHCLLDAAAMRDVPAVLVDYWSPKLGARADCVVTDNQPGYLGACAWLLQRGLRRIHFVGAYSASHTTGNFKTDTSKPGRVEPDSYLRMAAWRQAMDEAGIEPPADWTHFTALMRDPVEQLAEKLWARGAGQRPEALVCHTAGLAEQLREHFARRGGTLEAIGVAGPGQGRLTLDGKDFGSTAAALARSRIESRDPVLRPYVKAAIPTRFD